jgi:hypothetical protein
MNITVYSRTRLYETFARWDVPREFADTIANYLVYGYPSGSFFTAVLANDFMQAIASSHPSNTINSLKALAGWINEYCPKEAYGSYANVDAWCDITSAMRRPILEKNCIIYTEKEEVWMTLKGEHTLEEPVLY